jgi:hypothetical protein
MGSNVNNYNKYLLWNKIYINNIKNRMATFVEKNGIFILYDECGVPIIKKEIKSIEEMLKIAEEVNKKNILFYYEKTRFITFVSQKLFNLQEIGEKKSMKQFENKWGGNSSRFIIELLNPINTEFYCYWFGE